MEIVIFRELSLVFLAMTALSARTTSAMTLQKNNETMPKTVPLPDKLILPPWDRAAGVKDKNYLWPNAVVPYIISTEFGPRHANMIKSAMDAISQVSCITFKEWSVEPDYVSVESENGCHSVVGRRGGAQLLSLELPECVEHRAIVLHELLHVLGLIHEHSRPDRDEYVQIIMENIPKDNQFNFDPYSWDSVQNLTVPYDYQSVMQYNKYAFSKNQHMTLIPKKAGSDIPFEVFGLSEGDVKFINYLYSCENYV